MSEIFTPEFIPYYIEEVEKYKLTPTEGLLYGFIRFYNKRENKGFYFTSEQLAEIIKTTANMINKSLTALEKKGLIERQTKQYAGWSTRLIRLSDTLLNSKEPPNQTDKTTLPNSKVKEEYNKENNNKNKYFEDSKLNDSFLLFIENRKQMRKKMTDIAIDRMLKKLNGWLEKHGSEKVAWFINTSIENGWQGIFEKDEPKKPEKMAYETTERGKFTF